MRLIDADTLYKKLNDIREKEVFIHGRLNNKDCYTLSTALYEIECAPTIEPVEPEIVRCKDCKHRGEKPISDGRYWCNIHDAFMYYCSDARKENRWIRNGS